MMRERKNGSAGALNSGPERVCVMGDGVGYDQGGSVGKGTWTYMYVARDICRVSCRKDWQPVRLSNLWNPQLGDDTWWTAVFFQKEPGGLEAVQRIGIVCVCVCGTRMQTLGHGSRSIFLPSSLAPACPYTISTHPSIGPWSPVLHFGLGAGDVCRL